MYGSYYYGQAYWAQGPVFSAADTRTWCGGAWATASFGQMYFGGHIQCPEPPPPTPATRTWCGGMWATATFGQMYWGGHIQCPEPVPPSPPVPPGGFAGGSGGVRGRRDRPFDLDDHRRWVEEENRRRFAEDTELKRHLAQDELDLEDLNTIILAWLTTK